MIVRSLDADNDWTFGKGRNDYLSGNAAIGQSIKTRLQSFLGDCFFDVKAGLDWFNLLGSKDRLALELGVRATIMNTTGVTGIVDVSIDLLSNRLIKMQYTVETVYSQANLGNTITSASFLLLTESGDVLTTEDGTAIGAG